MMTQNELSNKLKIMYDNAPKGEKAVTVHLFGIQYANELSDKNITIKEVVKAAKVPNSYYVEVAKGINLARYVKIK